MVSRFKHLKILSHFYVTYTVSYCNTNSLRCAFVPVPAKGLYHTVVM